MSFRIDLRTAPEQRGSADAPDISGAWTTNSGPVPTIHGLYDGVIDKTFTFTANETGAIGTAAILNVDWDDGEGNTGRFRAGTNVSYTAADKKILAEGLELSFAAGSFTATDTFTLAVNAEAKLPFDHEAIEGSVNPTYVNLIGLSKQSLDGVTTTENGDMRVHAHALLSVPSVNIDYQANRLPLLRMRHARQEVTFAENYDANTEFLWRASAGLKPLIGRPVSLTRATVASYFDMERQVYRHAASGDPRFQECKNAPGIHVSKALRTNLLTQSHGKSGTLGWLLQGSTTTTWDATVAPVLDPTDTSWETGTTEGTVRCYLPQGAPNGVWTNPAVNAVGNVVHTAYVWIKGRGIVTVRLWDHTDSAAVDAAQVTLSDTWQKVIVSGTTAVVDHPHRIHVLTDQSGDEESFCWLSHAQFQNVPVASSAIVSAGSAGSINADVMTINHFPPIEGTFSFVVRPHGELQGTNTYYMFDTDTVAGWAIYYSKGSPNQIFFETAASGNRSVAGTFTLADDTPTHIAVTWKRSAASADKLDVAVYADGVSLGTSTDRDWDLWSVAGNGIRVGSTANGILWDWTFQEMRLDRRALSALEVADLYNRVNAEEWLHLHREGAGRRYRISSVSESWIDGINPDRMLATVELTQSSMSEDNALVPR